MPKINRLEILFEDVTVFIGCYMRGKKSVRIFFFLKS